MCKKGILIVSFGTSFNKTKEKTLDRIEKNIKSYYSNHYIYTAFTSIAIIEKIYNKYGIKVNSVSNALNLMLKNGIKNIIVQPTYVINGTENKKLINQVKKYSKYFNAIKIGSPLIETIPDCIQIIKTLKNELSYISDNKHIILMGHGSLNSSNNPYLIFNQAIKYFHLNNYHLALLNGFPSLNSVINTLKKSNVKKVYLVPLMIVAGKHALKDMTGNNNNTWEKILINEGFNVKCILKGLGEYESISKIYINHIKHSSSLS